MKPQTILAKIFIMVMSIAVCIYTVVQLLTVFTFSVETEHALLTTTEKKVESMAYMFRDETVLYNQARGVTAYTAQNGSKIQANTVVAQIYSDSGAADVQTRLENVRKKIKVLEESSIDSAYAVNNVSSIDEGLYERLFKMRYSCVEGDYSLALLQNEDFLVDMNKRQLIVKSVASFDEQLAVLKNEEASLAAGMSGVLGTVTSNVSGYFYSDVDGYESQFGSSVIKTLTPESFENLIGTAQAADITDAKGKVATSYVWYTCVVLDKNDSEEILNDKYYSLAFPYSSDVRVEGKVVRRTESEDGKRILVCFEIKDIPENFDYMRSQNMNIIIKTYKGLQVPKSALRMVDGEEGVFVLSGNKVVFKKVRRLFANEGYYILELLDNTDEGYSSHIKLNDNVIISGNDLYDGKVIE